MGMETITQLKNQLTHKLRLLSSFGRPSVPAKLTPNHPQFVETSWPPHPGRHATELEQYTK
jgi:hypothetical protein